MNVKFIVAIGYSEGGLEPLFSFFDHIPHDQATYVVLRHVPSNQRGILNEILKRHSKLDILEAEDGMEIENDKVYIPPSDSYLTIRNNTLHLQLRSLHTAPYNCSIDVFLKSLAESKGKNSLAVILSGEGMDGARGVAELHNAGGITVVQDPATCTHPGMPQSAIDTGFVHHILPVSEIPYFIRKYVDPILKNENLLRRING